MRRCRWATREPLIAYHDREWGVPVRDDRTLFAFLVLEGAQAGLSWETVLKRREGYRRAFAGFDPRRVARFTARDRARLLADPGIIRNRAKIAAAVGNARAFLRLQQEHGSFSAFLWELAGGVPVQGGRRLAARSALSDRLSRALRARGFRFVGTTICHAFLQAVGVINDHERGCFRHAPLAAAGRGAPRGATRARRRPSGTRPRSR
jgi:DNA-3-methyladenine glycosylase I